MKIDRIILSVDDNPAYKQHVKLVCEAWKELTGIVPDVAIVEPIRIDYALPAYITHAIDEYLDMPSANRAKIARLLLAARYTDSVCMLSDIDMLPLNTEMVDAFEPISMDNDGIACFGADAFDSVDLDANQAHGVVPICYLAGKGSAFAGIIDGTLEPARAWTHLRANPWAADFSDESMLRHLGIGDVIARIPRGWPGGMARGRIDRGSWYVDRAALADGEYIDAHLPRIVQPYHRLEQLVNPMHNGAFK